MRAQKGQSWKMTDRPESCIINDTQYDPDQQYGEVLPAGMRGSVTEEYVAEALYDAATTGDLYEYSDPVKPEYLMPVHIKEPPTLPSRPSLVEARPPPEPPKPLVIHDHSFPKWLYAVLGLYAVMFAVVFATRPTLPPPEVLESTEMIISANAFGFVGQVSFFATTRLPEGWVVCDGRQLSTADHPALAAALGANGTNFTVPDMVTEGLFPRGGLDPGTTQPYATAVDDVSAIVKIWDYKNPSDLVAYTNDQLDPDAPLRQSATQLRISLSTRTTNVGLYSYTFPVNVTSDATETRPPAIVLVPAIYVREPIT